MTELTSSVQSTHDQLSKGNKGNIYRKSNGNLNPKKSQVLSKLCYEANYVKSFF